MKRVLFFWFFLYTGAYLFGQDTTDVRNFSPVYFESHEDSLCHYSTNKKFLSHLEVPALIALSHYPELKDTKIIFIEKSIHTTAACLPKWTFLFQSKKNRVYKIFFNNDTRKLKGALVHEVPFDAQIGLIGHELGHVADYSKKGVFGILGMAFQYIFIPGRSKIEKRVDSITIAHYLGWQLYDFEDFIFYRSKVSKEYKAYKRKIYVAPEELRKMIGARGK